VKNQNTARSKFSTKSAGEILFDSYDRNKAMCDIKQVFKTISHDFPPKTWEQLSNGDRENWERIAAENWQRIDRECFGDRISGISGVSFSSTTRSGSQ
jgi:hypothetical protein